MSVSVGARIGPYEILEPLGAGGMGEVYRARDSRLDRDVAIKVLTAATRGDAAAAARLSREARSAAAVSHPNVLAVFDVGEHHGSPFIVTELLQGTTLRTPISGGSMAVPLVLRFAVQIANGLGAAHDKGVVHRDLKPENIIVTTDRRVKILDFGLARPALAAVSAGDVTRISADTDPGVVMGTAGYMSPEQARGLAVDHRSDLFAVGAVLFEMLAGRRPFRGDTMTDTMAAVVRDQPPDLEQLNPAVPTVLARIVSRCLAKDPAERFQSAHDLALALEAISGAGSQTSAPPSPVRTDTGIVVLPFDNLSADADNEFFADGLTEEITSDLAKVHGLRVISRTSAMQFKGRRGNLPELVRALGVRYVLEGSVRKAGERLRISAQLIDTTTDTHVWSDKYNGTLEDVFDMQERVARAIADALRVTLTPEESRALARRPIEDPVAYECYLRARAALRAFDEPQLHRAIRDIEDGLARAGENPLLLATKGDAAWQLYNIGLAPAEPQMAEVRAIAERIATLDPSSPHVERLLGLVAAHTGRMVEAARRLKKAAELEPGDTFSALLAICALAFVGRTEEAERLQARVQEIDPLDPIVAAMRMWVTMMSGRFEEAAEVGTREYDRWSGIPAFVTLYVQALASAGRVSEAIRVAQELERTRPSDQWTWFSQSLRWALQGDGASLFASVTAERRAWVLRDAQYSHLLAQAFALAGHADQAFEWLDVTLGLGAAPYPYLSHFDPLISTLRSDERWPAFIARTKVLWEQVVI